MTRLPLYGLRIFKKPIAGDLFKKFRVEPARNLADYQKVVAIRSIVYMAEQNCPYGEEFDGNDLCATHLLAFEGDRPVATLRIRWFSDFAKLERLTIAPGWRGSGVLFVILAHCFEIVGRKGYRLLLGQVQTRWVDMWLSITACEVCAERPVFSFSDYEYKELKLSLPEHPRALGVDDDPYVIIRPEGDWDSPGVLDADVSAHGDIRAA